MLTSNDDSDLFTKIGMTERVICLGCDMEKGLDMASP